MTSQTKARARETAIFCALAGWVLLLVVGSLVPGRIVSSWPAVMAELEAGATIALHEPILVTVIERFAAFFPLGSLVFWVACATCRWPRTVSGVAVVLFALLLELGQGFVETRHPRLTDFLLATAFGWLGLEVAARSGLQPSLAWGRRLLFANLAIGNVVIAVIVTQSHLDARIKGWDCDFPLVVANEASADRPWRGRIRGMAFYPHALAAEDLAHLAAVPFSSDGLRSRQDAGALMAYHFDDVRDRRVAQVLPNGPELDLLLPPPGSSTWRPGAGALDVLGPIEIRGSRAPRELCAAVVASGAFTVEVAIASTDLTQGGPARIVSQSSDARDRNFTLGAESGRLVARVRTPWNGLNGTNLPLETEAEVLTRDWQHVAFGYETDGAAFLFLDGSRIAHLPYRTMLLVDKEVAIDIALVVGLLLVAMGAIASILFRARRWSIECARVYGAQLPALVVVGVAVWFAHAQDLLLLAAAALGPGVGLTVVRVVRAVPTWRHRIFALALPGSALTNR